MRKLRITQGKIKAVPTTATTHEGLPCYFDIKIGNQSFISTFRNSAIGVSFEQEQANAELIADAFNTANKCDMLPSELLEQRDELLKALKSIISTNGDISNTDYMWIIGKNLILDYAK